MGKRIKQDEIKREGFSRTNKNYQESIFVGKKAQVSVFIIIAILILIVIVSYFLVTNEVLDFGVKVDSDVRPIYNLVESCLEETSVDAIYYIGETGGYFVPSELSTEDGIAYYYLDRESYVPDKGFIENEISLYVENFIGFCLNDIIDFPDFELNYVDSNVIVEIKDNEVFVTADYPISLKKGDKAYSFDRLEFSFPVRFGIVYNVSAKIIQNQINDNGDVCINCINDMVEDKDLIVNMFDLDNETLLFVIRDENSKINNLEFRYFFASK